MTSKSNTRLFPGFSRLFVLQDPLGKAYRAAIDVSDAFALTRGTLRLPSPVDLRWAMGKGVPTDAIRTTSVAPIIVHEHITEVLEKHRFRGWSTYPVAVFDKGGVRVPGYQGLSILGRCGPIDDTKSQRVGKRYPAGIFPVWKGLFFAPDTWDGSDLFMPAGNVGWIFVVEEVKQALTKARIKNVEFTTATEVERQGLDILA